MTFVSVPLATTTTNATRTDITVETDLSAPSHLPLSATNSFVYNGIGQRVGKTDSTGTLSYKLADDAIDANVLADGQATYQYGMGLVSEIRGGNTRVYHADSLGTTRAMSSSSGSASASLETDAFGQTVSVGGTFTPFGFAGGHGYQSDPDSGLMKLGHRYYDASTGRFLSRDPIQAGENWYIYCENDPTNSLDPLGLDRIIKIPIEGSSDKLPAHFYIEFDEPVEIPDPDNPNKKIKTRTIGFWPGNDQSNPFIPKPGQFKAPDDYQNRKDVKKIVVRESKDKQFNDDLRQVVREIVSKGRVYQLPKYTCMDFVTEAWDEARSRRGWVFPWQGD